MNPAPSTPPPLTFCAKITGSPARDVVALQPLLDEVDERYLLIALLAGDEVHLLFEPPAHRVEILHELAALRHR